MTELEPRRVAAFDFDGTLARRDTLLSFMARAAGPRRAAAVVGAEGYGAVRSRVGRGPASSIDREDLKVSVLGRIFAGVDPARFEALAAAHGERIERLLRPDMRERVAWHRGEGHELVIVSASLAAYLRPIASKLGIDHVIAVEMEVGPDGLLTGQMVGPNVRGEEKATRLRAWLGEDRPCEVWAYGDSSGDEALLAMADHPTWIGRRAKRPPKTSTR